MTTPTEPQLDLFGGPAPRSAHTPAPAVAGRATSVLSGQQILDAMPELRRQVFAFIRVQGGRGATDDEMQAAMGLNPSTQRPRRIELERQGFIRQDPEGRTRETRSGRQAVVWVMVPEAERQGLGERRQVETEVRGALHHFIAALDLEQCRAAIGVLRARFPSVST